jgi:acyl-CoA synthetase (AMP-forming)/AMP-acid ligase II
LTHRAGDVLTASGSTRQQAAVAGALAARGLAAGDRVAFVCGNSTALLSASIGALRAGIVSVPVNPSLTVREQRVLLDDADASLVVRGDAELRALLDDAPAGDLADVPLSRPMHYTSGTTGKPKGVWMGVRSEADARALHDDEAAHWGFAGDDRLLICSPLYHSAPNRFGTGVLLAGGTVLVLERFDVDAVAAAIVEFRPTVAFMVPTHLQRLRSAYPGLDVSSFRLLVHAGAPCPIPLKRAVLDAFPSGAVWEFYGATETQFTVCSPSDWIDRPGTVGRARQGRQLSIADNGIVWCSVPRWAHFEYWRDPARTAAAWRGDACTAGDLGHLDEGGFLFLDGRREDLIISGGTNVYPVEVEEVIAGHPDVRDVAVFGAPDDDWGQRVCAAVVGSVDPDVLRGWVRERVAGYKCPKDVYVVDELPRTSTGKLRRVDLASVLGVSG